LAYNSGMTRLILAILGFSLMQATAAIAQVKITVPTQRYNAHDEIRAKVENTGNIAVTFCVEFGQTSMKGGDVESTPSPFWVQGNSDGKWGTLMIGPDVGSIRTAEVLEAGESREFPFRLNDSGRMRLRLNYWRGSITNFNCKAPPTGPKLVTSDVFTILPISSQLEKSGYAGPIITAAPVGSFSQTREVTNQNSCFTVNVHLNGELVDGPKTITFKTRENEKEVTREGKCFAVPLVLLEEKTIDVFFAVPANKLSLSAIPTGFFAGTWDVDLEDERFDKGIVLPKNATTKETCVVVVHVGEPETTISQAPCRSAVPLSDAGHD
jgi:hypothetical protein